MSKIAFRVPSGIPFVDAPGRDRADSIRRAIAFLAAEARDEGFDTAAHLLEAAALDMVEQAEIEDSGGLSGSNGEAGRPS